MGVLSSFWVGDSAGHQEALWSGQEGCRLPGLLPTCFPCRTQLSRSLAILGSSIDYSFTGSPSSSSLPLGHRFLK